MKYEVRTPEQALAYITDCTLATVSSMASRKSRQKYEYARQIGIAETAIGWMKNMGVPLSGTRAEMVERYGSVELWAKQYEPEPPQ